MRMNEHRIVVFTGNYGYSVRKGIAAIDRAIPGVLWLVVVHSRRKAPSELLHSQWTNLKKNGWRWIPYQTADIWRRIGARMAAAATHRMPGCAAISNEKNATCSRVEVLKVADLHAEPTLTTVKDFAPTLGLALAAPILRRPLFAMPTLGTINLHKGKVPDYRGMPPAFWELWNGEASVGCTIHRVDDKLDTGDVVLAASVDREPYSTVRGMQLRLDEVGVHLMREAVQQVLSGTTPSVAQALAGKTYRKPSLAQIAELDARLLRNQTPAVPVVKRIAKSSVSAGASMLWHLGLAKLLKPRLTVLLYHRVSDSARDNLTVGIEQFDRQMALLRKHCMVLSIEQALALTAIPRSPRPLVCVTFDDGYLDNYTNAAPILLKHEIPTAFFVSTGLIGTERAFPHDVRRGNQAIPMMTWDHLRAMRSDGFQIGSHTVNHIDCAAEPEQVVRHELAQSRDDLRRELGLENIVLGYPYGGRRHMTPERLELVRQAGYVGCLSAYGGTNIGAVDPFNLLRRGIHWEYSDRSFMFECLGLK